MNQFFKTSLWVVMFTFQVVSIGAYSILVRLSVEQSQFQFSVPKMNFCIEFFKLGLSILTFHFFADSPSIRPFNFKKSLYFSIPSLLYFINNNLCVYIQLHMDSTSYQILTNFKILSTALLYYLIIGKPLTRLKWFSLVLLFLAGVLYVYGNVWNETDGELESTQLFVTKTGLCMMVLYVSISGLAGVYTEFILKANLKDSIFMQSIYLYAYGSAYNLCGFLVEALATSTDSQSQASGSLFLDDGSGGFNRFTWLIIATQIYNGLCMSVIMKYSNNITRLFVISCSLLVTTVLSVALFSVQLNFYFYCVALVTLLAIYFYLYEDFHKK